VCGLYVDPPENVLVVSIDEKTAIQAKSPTKPDTPPAAGRPARREHEYKPNGTQCLFAALKVHHGDVLAIASKTRNRYDLIGFLASPTHASWLMAQPDRDLLLDLPPPPAQARHLHQRDRPRRADARLHRDPQPDRQAV